MRRVLFVLLFSLPAMAQYVAPAGFNPGATLSAPTLMQVGGCAGVSGSITCTPSAITAGDTVVLFGMGNSSTCTSATGTGYSFLMWQTTVVGGSNHLSVFIARNVAGGSTTITMNCTGTNSGGVFYEFAPQAGKVVAGDVIGFATGTGGTPSVTTINSVGVPVEEVMTTIYDNSNFRTLTAGTGLTMQQRVLNSSHAANCTTTCLGGSADNNTKTGLTGTQTGSITGISTDSWNLGIFSVANTPTQDAADTYVSFEGLSNTVSPTVAQLQASTYGVPGVWTQPSSSNFTGATGSQGTTTPAAHQVGASSLSGSGSLGLAYATGTVNNDLLWTFPQGTQNFSWIGQFQTSLPQNDTNLNAYTLLQINENAAADYLAPQIQANGSALNMFLECKTGPGSGSIAISTNTLYYLSLNAYSGASIASFTGTSGTLTFTTSANNSFFSGETLTLGGFTGGNTGLNAQTVTVLSAGLTSTTFEATVTGSGYSSGTGTAAGVHTMSIYNSSGSQVGTTKTCAGEPQALSWTKVNFGVNGAEAESSGHVISFDNIRFSLTGQILTP